MTTMNGSCLCGKVRFAAEGVEAHYHACHCSMCRRWGGGPVLAAWVKGVTFEGTPKKYSSSDWAERGFCGECGSHLYYFFKPTNAYAIPIGVFADAAALALGREIFVDSKPAHYAFVGEHPRLTEAEVLAAFSDGQNTGD